MTYNTRVEKIDHKLIKKKQMEMLKNHPAVQQAADLLSQGETVAFPTETVYGLGADATNKKAVNRIYKAKGRPADNPLIVHIAHIEQLYQIIAGDLSEIGDSLIKNFWPGPLTLIFPKKEFIPAETTAGLDTVAVRMPSHALALALIEVANLPLAAPSANISGAPSPTRAIHVLDDFKGSIPLILDGGPCPVGVESTVVDIRGDKVEILRPGGISREELQRVTGNIFEEKIEKSEIDSEIDSKEKKIKNEYPISPGMKYRHYSPQTPLYIIDDDNHNKIVGKIKGLLQSYTGMKMGFILSQETIQKINELKMNYLKGQTVKKMGARKNPEEIASRLFNLLRELDKMNLDRIYIEAISTRGIGEAVMNRIYKAGITE